MALVGVGPDGGLLALFSLLFGFGGLLERVSVTGTGGGMLASFAPGRFWKRVSVTGSGGFEKSAALPR